jgi:hypothetical protein
MLANYEVGQRGKALSRLSSAIMLFLMFAVFSSGQEIKKPSASPSGFKPETLSIPADSPRWDLQGEAKVSEYLGRKCIALEGGAAIAKDFEMRDGVLDADVATSGKRGFFGF